jgi:hypothetical protein
MSTIPNEYSSFDFGFTAVDDPDAHIETETPVAPSIDTDELLQPLLERLRSIEINVGEILNSMERLEQVGTPDLDTEEYKALIEKDVREKLKKVEAMVMPLLTNLLKDADKKDFIKWPNRRPIIESFIEKFLAVTRS